MKNDIRQLFTDHHGFVTTKTLKQQGFHYKHIQNLVAQQFISKIKHGLYKWQQDANNQDEFIEVAQLVPKGVLCLLSAAFYYELTTFVPAQYQIAIHRKDKITLPDYPPIKIFYWSDIAYNLGKQQIVMDNCPITIYDIEKTVCDAIKYRDKIGMDTCKEIIRNYLDKEDRNLVKLTEYAKKMAISGIVSNFITISI